MAHVPLPESAEVAAAQLAVHAQVEEGEFSNPDLHLEPYAQRPDFLELEGRTLSGDLALVPRLALSGVARISRHGLPSSCGSCKMRS